MKLKTTLLTMLVLITLNGLLANPVTKETAVLAANTWIQNQQNGAKNSEKQLSSIDEVYHESKLVYFIMKYDNGGFVIVSADDATKPILAYSYTAQFDSEAQNDTTKGILNAYKTFLFVNAKKNS